jgi:hypothetical protein
MSRVAFLLPLASAEALTYRAELPISTHRKPTGRSAIVAGFDVEPKMLWPFNRFRNPSVPRGTIEAIYGMIVAQAREPAFYTSLGVRDTVNELAQALSKNVFNGEALDSARALAAYVREASEKLGKSDDAAVRKGVWTFPEPRAKSPQVAP